MRLMQSRRGVAAVEFAVVGVALIMLATGFVDTAIPVWLQLQVNQAAQAGAMYAALAGYSTYSQTATNAAITSATGMTATSVTATSPTNTAIATSCYCPTTSGLTTATCGNTCANAQTAHHYAVLTASTTYTPISPYFNIGGSAITVTATSYARLD